MNTQFFTNNGNQKFPLSTEALNFMQEQIKLAYGLTDLAGENIIVRQSSATETGLVIFDGELLPLTGNPAQYITIAESTEPMYVEGRFVGNVRTTRTAHYVIKLPKLRAGSSSKTKRTLNFTVLKNISTLMSELDAAKQHHVPTGAIMMWSGAITTIPNGWALCDGTNGTPDLRGRFIVGASNGEITMDGYRYKYDVGSTGGKNKVALTVNEMPSHNHGGSTSEDGNHNHYSDFNTYKSATEDSADDYTRNRFARANGDYEVQRITSNSTGEHAHTISAQGGGQAHENRPPYYALAYIIKII